MMDTVDNLALFLKQQIELYGDDLCLSELPSLNFDKQAIVSTIDQSSAEEETTFSVSEVMSVDWQKYRTALETLNDHRTERITSDFGVVSLNVGKIREFHETKIDVVYDPKEDNQAHSLVEGFPSNTQREKDPQLKKLQTSLRNYLSDMNLSDIKWEIHPQFEL